MECTKSWQLYEHIYVIYNNYGYRFSYFMHKVYYLLYLNSFYRNEKQEKSNFNLILASLMKNEIYPFKNQISSKFHFAFYLDFNDLKCVVWAFIASKIAKIKELKWRYGIFSDHEMQFYIEFLLRNFISNSLVKI